jgi:hypothetical protein
VADTFAVIISIIAFGVSIWAAVSAAKVARAEVGRDHKDNGPRQNGRFVTRGGLLFYEFTLDQPYEVRARVTGHGGAVANDQLPARSSADGTYRVSISSWEGQRLVEHYDTLTISFWPPERRTGEPEPWTCPCGRPVQVGDASIAHWQWTGIGVPQQRRAVQELES